MRSRWDSWGRAGIAVGLAAGAASLAVAPRIAPAAVFIVLATTAWPLVRAWRAARGTALTSAVVWATLAVALGLVSQAAACAEPLAAGRPIAGHATYLSALATLAALVSVLNARTPGAGAWAILMGLLVLVFLIPWLEAPGLARNPQGLGRLRLHTPWTIFYVLVVVAGVTNYLPTRYGPAAAWLALGFAIEYVGLTRPEVAIRYGGTLWSVFPWTLAAAIWTADRRSRRTGPRRDGLEAAWSWFRDHWGVVWALRVRERFNRTAEAQRWPIRLGWYGAVPVEATVAGVPATPAAAEATFKGLLRRFAGPERVEEVTSDVGRAPCQPPDAG